MADTVEYANIADMPAQKAGDPATPAEARARYFNTGNAFDVRLTPVPDALFVEEAVRALDPATATGFFTCDISDVLECPFPATSPLLLARYARVNPGERLTADFDASSIIAYVIAGHGHVTCGMEELVLGSGDIVVLPGGAGHTYRATGADAIVLWIVTNEPQLAHENLRPAARDEAVTDLIHYPAAEMARQIDLIHRVGRDEEIAGSALILSSDRPQAEARRNALPTMTIAMNSLEPGTVQRSHRHNAVAVSLIVEGEDCFSTIDGNRKDWAPWATTITPAGSFHSHHNEGARRAFFLIIQDGGLFYHARAMGFAYEDE